MKKEKLKLLKVIFKEYGYEIKKDEIYNKKGEKIGFEVKQGRNKGLKLIGFSIEGKVYTYTKNEVLGWKKGLYKDEERPEGVFVTDNLEKIDTKERMRKNIKYNSLRSESRLDVAVWRYFNHHKSIRELSKKHKVWNRRLSEEVKFISEIMGIEFPRKYDRRNKK